MTNNRNPLKLAKTEDLLANAVEKNRDTNSFGHISIQGHKQCCQNAFGFSFSLTSWTRNDPQTALGLYLYSSQSKRREATPPSSWFIFLARILIRPVWVICPLLWQSGQDTATGQLHQNHRVRGSSSSKERGRYCLKKKNDETLRRHKQKMSTTSGEHNLDCLTSKTQAWKQRILILTEFIHTSHPILFSRMASNFPSRQNLGQFSSSARNSF